MYKILAIAAVLFTALLCVSIASADELFKATPTGDQEVPPVITNTTGRAFLWLNKAETAAKGIGSVPASPLASQGASGYHLGMVPHKYGVVYQS